MFVDDFHGFLALHFFAYEFPCTLCTFSVRAADLNSDDCLSTHSAWRIIDTAFCSVTVSSSIICISFAVAEWVRALDWRPDGPGFESHCGNFSLRNFGNSVYPALPVSFGGDPKSRRSLLSGVYARGSKRPHQSALE